MISFIVKHLVQELGPITEIYPSVKKQPFCYTSKKGEANEASKNNNVYVIEVRTINRKTEYRLAYKFKATECFSPAGNHYWLDKFKYKITTTIDTQPELSILEEPIVITDVDFNNWFKGQSLGMCKIPTAHIDTLESIFKYVKI